MSMPMFSSGPSLMFPGEWWQAWLRIDPADDPDWVDVVLLLPTDRGVTVLVAPSKVAPRWYDNAVLRRRPE